MYILYQGPFITVQISWVVAIPTSISLQSVLLQDSHPQEQGASKDVTICFTDYIGCLDVQQIRVTNCGDFYVYFLPETPQCFLRYCAADSL